MPFNVVILGIVGVPVIPLVEWAVPKPLRKISGSRTRPLFQPRAVTHHGETQAQRFIQL